MMEGYLGDRGKLYYVIVKSLTDRLAIIAKMNNE
jgi:hypothetical protein